MARPIEGRKSTQVRLPDALKAALRHEAIDAGMTLEQYIINILENRKRFKKWLEKETGK